MVADRPAPASSTDVLLSQIRVELVGLRQELVDARGGAGAPSADGRVELREPRT